MALTDKQRRFVDEYLVDLNATQAAIRAGYSQKTAGQIGEQNLKKLEIAQAIQEAQSTRAKRTEVTQDMVLQELAKIGFSDIRKIVRWGKTELRVADDEEDGKTAPTKPTPKGAFVAGRKTLQAPYGLNDHSSVELDQRHFRMELIAPAGHSAWSRCKESWDGENLSKPDMAPATKSLAC